MVVSCLIPTLSFVQKYALIDKNLKLPIIYTDSVTVEQVSKGWIPIENKNFDTLAANLKYLMQMLDKRQRAKMQSLELHSGNLIIATSRVPYAYGDRYNAKMNSDCGAVKAEFTLINSNNSNKNSSAWLNKFLAYLKNNKSIWKEPNEITPKLYNVIVITD